jgi:hypothetical protein
VLFFLIRSVGTTPVTARPKIGSGRQSSGHRPGRSRLLAGKTPALHHFAGNFRRQGINRPAKNGNRHNRFSAHRENIADGVGGGDTAKVERVVDNRHKKSVVLMIDVPLPRS